MSDSAKEIVVDHVATIDNTWLGGDDTPAETDGEEEVTPTIDNTWLGGTEQEVTPTIDNTWLGGTEQEETTNNSWPWKLLGW